MRAFARLLGLLALAASAVTLGAPGAQAAGPPQVNSTWVAEVKASSVDVHGLVNPNELATTVRTEYITEAAYQANLGATPPKDGFVGALKAPIGSPISVGSGSTDQPYLQHIGVGAIKASTAYRYRIAATNEAGTTPGPARTFTTPESAPLFSLPDERGWELVSPVDKNGGQVEGAEANFGGGVLQAASDGGSVTFSSRSSFGPAQGAPGASQYVSRRGNGGWGTENLTVPLLSGGYDTSPGAGVPYQLFSTDLATGLLSNGRRCRGEGSGCPVANPPLVGSGAPAGYRNYYLRNSADGGFQALLTTAALAGLTLDPEDFEVAFAAATPDLKQVVLSSCAALAPNATEVPGTEGECDPAATNLYLWSASGLALINLLPGETQGTPGAALAAQSGAVSTGGLRVYWSDQATANLYLREGGQTVQVDSAVGGGGAFQSASADGSIAFFTKAGHLYRYLAAAKTATDLTPGGEVQGVLGASEDGSYLYYLSTAGLFLWHNGATTPIAPEADASNYPPTTGTARVSADGAYLAFVSAASLTGYDSGGTSEVFLYGPPPGGGAVTLTCASCNPSGARPAGPSSIPGAIANGKALQAYKPRVLSADATRLFFDSADALVSLDTNGDQDVYQWEAQGAGGCTKAGGCIGLISSGQSIDGASFIDASADGSDVFFLTGGSLVPTDPGSVDLYDARVGGGFPIAPAPIPCVADACQGLPGEPEDPAPGTLFVRPEGNPPVSLPKSNHKKRHHKAKHHKKRHHHKNPQGRAAHPKHGGSK